MNTEELAVFLNQLSNCQPNYNTYGTTTFGKNVSSFTFHYYEGPTRRQVIATIKSWLIGVNSKITMCYKINHDTGYAVTAALNLFGRFWKKMGVLETSQLKMYLFSCYSIMMKFMYDAIDYVISFKYIGFQFTKKDVVTAEYKIMDVLDWKII